MALFLRRNPKTLSKLSQLYRDPFGYGVEEVPAFCPRTQAFMFFQSGSSSDANCLPPWCVSARPPASGASGIRRNRLKDGSPGTTSFETTSKLWREKVCPGRQHVEAQGSATVTHYLMANIAAGVFVRPLFQEDRLDARFEKLVIKLRFLRVGTAGSLRGGKGSGNGQYDGSR